MNEFEQGYAFAVKQGAATWGAAAESEYVEHVEQAISKLYKRMNSYNYYKATIPSQESLKGFIAEEWASGTLNVDAAVKGKSALAEVLKSTDLGSVDVATLEGGMYQLKFYLDPSATVKALGTTLREVYQSSKASATMSFDEWAASKGFTGKLPTDLLYDGQWGVVPSDKLTDCQMEAFKRLSKAKALDCADEVSRWKRVSDALTDKLETTDGISSRPQTLEDARQKAIAISRNEELLPEADGMTTAELIKVKNLIVQSLKAGATAAAISAVVKIAPEIYKAIDYLIAGGELDEESLKTIGAATFDGGKTGFINGSATAAITIATGKGVFGQAIKTAISKPFGPTVIGTLVVLTVETCRDAYLLTRGKRTAEDFANNLAQDVFVTIFTLAGAAVASIIAPEATVPILIGSAVGSAVGCLAFAPVKSCILQASTVSGLTLFGLIEQDESLPPQLLKEIGVKGARFKTAEYRIEHHNMPDVHTVNVKQSGLHTLDVKQLRRDVVGINKVGYVLA